MGVSGTKGAKRNGANKNACPAQRPGRRAWDAGPVVNSERGEVAGCIDHLLIIGQHSLL
jgi:hypothetical protein